MKQFRRNGKLYTLCAKSSIQSALDYVSWVQTVTGHFLNVSIIPYRGHNYNRDKFVWIVEG